jgi:hypothetical protein
MAQDELQDAIDQLYGTPLDAFVDERKRLAKELRAGGERQAAETLAKLPKPSAAAWALNHVARNEPDAVEEWTAAADALRDASNHPSEVGGDALRAAMADHRAATARLMDVVGDRARPGDKHLSGAMLDRVRALLQQATADEALASRLRAGRVTEDQAAAELAPPVEAKPARAKATKRSAPRDAAAEARAERRRELERRVEAASREARRLRAEADARTAAADTARERFEDARRALQRTESELAAAQGAADDAVGASDDAERELKRLRGLLRRSGA